VKPQLVRIISGNVKSSCKDVVITDVAVTVDDMQRIKSKNGDKVVYQNAGLRTKTGNRTGQMFMSRLTVAVLSGSIGIFPDNKLKQGEGIPYSKGEKFVLEGESLVHSMRFVRHGKENAVIAVIVQA
jgi:hypothetical protein